MVPRVSERVRERVRERVSRAVVVLLLLLTQAAAHSGSGVSEWGSGGKESLACITRTVCVDDSLLRHSHSTTRSGSVSERVSDGVCDSDSGKESECMSECVVQEVLSSTACVYSSTLTVAHRAAVPDSQGWARCQHCHWHTDHFEVIRLIEDPESTTPSLTHSVDISWSYWGEFFHYQGHADRVKAHVKTFTRDELQSHYTNKELFRHTYIINRPVFYIPIIAFHYGHILIDVLEQLHGAMMDSYGRVRKDAVLLLDSANQAERELLQTMLHNFCNTKNDNDSHTGSHSHSGSHTGSHFSLLLTWFTSAPVMSVSELLTHQKRFLFTDIHLGGDLKHSFFSEGMLRQPCHFTPMSTDSESHLQRLSVQYKEFRDYLWSQYLPPEWVALSEEEQMFSSSSPAELDVLFVQRKGSREIKNMQDLVSITNQASLTSEILDLADVSFIDQLAYLHFTQCVFASAGTATHNMIFMRPGSVMVIAMQPEWCEFSWMYVNQGILLGITVHVLCDDSDAIHSGKQTRHSSFVNKFWKQGPRGAKDANVTVNLKSFEEIINSMSRFGNVMEHLRLNSDKSTDHWCFGMNADSVSSTRQGTKFPPAEPELYVVMPSREDTDDYPLFRHLNRPFVRASIVKVSATLTPHPESIGENPQWLRTLSLHADITSNVAGMSEIFEYFPHLTICSIFWLLPEEQAAGPFCVRADALNYHSTIDTHLDVTQEELLIHMWYQVSEGGGKIRDSDCYVPISLSLPHHGLIFSPSQLLPQTSIECVVTAVSRDYLFSYTPTYRTSIQHATADFCRGYGLGNLACYRVAHQISQCVHARQTTSELSNIQLIPTPQDPFVFIHFEKVGGTSLRQLIYQSAAENDLDYYIPTYNAVPDMTFSLPTFLNSETTFLRNVSVIAGHFEWGVWKGLPSFSNSKRCVHCKQDQSSDTGTVVPRSPSCFMMGRHPVDRVISYYYQRCYLEPSCSLYQRRFSDLSEDDIYDFVVLFRQAKYLDDGTTLMFSDDGLYESVCRAALGERLTSGKVVKTLIDMHGGAIPSPDSLSSDKIEEAIANMNNCVIGMIHEWDLSIRMMKHWFPWMKLPSYSLKEAESQVQSPRLMKLVDDKESAKTLDPSILAYIQGLIPCDMALYENMMKRYDKQKHYLESF